MATYYVSPSGDNTTGADWAHAWTTLPTTTVHTPAAGDTVYIDGGATSVTYDLTVPWAIKVGTTGNRIIYQIGQDSGHNGLAIFNFTGTPPATWLDNQGYYTVSGKLGDGSDGISHIKLTGWQSWIGGNVPEVTLEYITETDDATLRQAIGCGGGECSSFTISRCQMKVGNWSAGANESLVAIGREDTTPGYAVNLVEYCTLELPKSVSGGNGWDGLNGGNGMSVRYNTISWFSSDYPLGPGQQHADGWQCIAGDYQEFIGNTVIGCPNYAFFREVRIAPGFAHLRAWNNRLIMGFDNHLGSPGAIVIGPGGGYNDTVCAIDDVTVYNNTIIDYDAGSSIAENTANQYPSGTPIVTTWTNCYIRNNALINSLPVLMDADPASHPTADHNVVRTAGQAATELVSYTQYGAVQDARLTTAATALIGQGTNLYSAFTTYRDGTSRANAAFDIGSEPQSGGGPITPAHARRGAGAEITI